MKYLKILLLLSTYIFIGTNFITFASLKTIDKIAAIVNNDVILESDVYNLMKLIKLNTNKIDQKLPDNLSLRHQILERLISDKIVLQIGERIGIDVVDNEIDRTIDHISKQNNMTIDQIKAYLSYDDISYSIYRNQIRNNLIISKVLNNEVSKRITILSQEIDDLANQLNNQKDENNVEMKLDHILISLPKNPSLEQITLAKNRADSIVNQAHNDSDFNKLSARYTSDNQRTIKDRYIGWQCIRKMPFVFSQVLRAAKKGDIVGPIRSEIGFHIFKVNDLRDLNKNIFVTEVHVRHILLKESPIMTGNQANTKLQQIASNIRSGKISFSDAAKKFSQDLHSANQGGDLGWAMTDIYDSVFREALTKLKKGQISTPIRSSVGWHIIELLDIRNVDRTDAIQKNRAHQILFNQKFSEETISWIREQRTNSYVKILSD